MDVKTSFRVSAVVGCLSVFATLPAAGQWGDRCEERMTMELQVPASGVSLLEVTARAGGLEIEGVDGLSEVRVDATLCASDADRMEGLDVTLERSGNSAVLEAVFPDRNRGWRDGYARIDLVVSVPTGMDADVVDGSGEIRIERVGALDIQDGSGEMVLRDIRGDLTVEDGSGEIEIEGVDGAIWLEDGSGEIEIEGVDGAVWLEDGSGEAVVAGVEGDVTVNDGSGELEIRGVAGNVTVEDKGSGQIEIENVTGDLTVQGTRRERIRYDNVGGTLDLPPARRRGRRGG